jgi:L-ascorbate metabolism protein UlaG (beta-lactamase superfamily)
MDPMIRHLAVLLVGLTLTPGAWAADTKKIIIRWHGQSFFEVQSSQGTRVVFDPHAIEEYGKTNVRADLVLISHLHNDHTQVDVLVDKDKAKIIKGLKGTRKRGDWNLIDEKFRDIRVRTVGVYHDTVRGLERGENTVFIVTMDDLRLVFLGDLGHLLTEEQVKEIGPVDVLFIPVGGVYTINGSEAKQVVEQLKPRQYIIPMHFGTKVFDEVLPVNEFLEDQKRDNIKIYSATNKLVVENDFKPTEPIIAVLNWK